MQYVKSAFVIIIIPHPAIQVNTFSIPVVSVASHVALYNITDRVWVCVKKRDKSPNFPFFLKNSRVTGILCSG